MLVNNNFFPTGLLWSAYTPNNLHMKQNNNFASFLLQKCYKNKVEAIKLRNVIKEVKDIFTRKGKV